MKQLTLLISALAIIYANAFTQGCLPQGITFTTQEQIDNFQTNYPGCTEIEGDVTIQGSGINNLNGLSVLTLIEGDVWIGGNNSLTNLIGLESLTNLEGNLSIIENSSLISLTGLESLNSTVGYISIYGNNALTSLTGLEGLTSIGWMLVIDFNNALTSLTGLDNLTEVGGFLAIGINSGNHSLTSLTGLENLTSIEGGLGLYYNISLTSLTGLESLISIAGELYIENNNSLTDLTGLENIAAGSISDLYIVNNASLSSCEVKSICDYLAAPNGDIEIYNNASGCNSKAQVIEACEASGIEEILSESELMLTPNPFTDQLIAEFALKIPGLVSIEIFNAIGTKVAELHHGQLPAGQQQFTWHAGHLPKGLYFCRVQAGEKTITQKIIKVQ